MIESELSQTMATVGELIKELKLYDEDIIIVVVHDGMNLDSVVGFNELNLEDVGIVAIEKRKKSNAKESDYVLADEDFDTIKMAIFIG